MAARWAVCMTMAVLLVECAVGWTHSWKLIHRFSEEVKGLRISRDRGSLSAWPERRSLEYYRMLMSSDVQRQKMKLGPRYQLLFPSEGSKAISLGNDFGWLHYTWIDIGMPNVSFLVALDTGSDLLWVPCDCIQCAPLSASYYNSLVHFISNTTCLSGAGRGATCKANKGSLVFGASIVQDRDFNEYSPSGSSTSKHLSCSHQLCELGPNCKNPKQPCPYIVNYISEDTSSSGYLVEDTLHFAAGSDDASNTSVQPLVILGCGRKQSGGYLDGVAPNGLMGLGLGEVSVPSLLAKAGLIHNSFSLCFDDDDSGRIFLGDKGPAAQQSTPFMPLDGKFITYIVGVEASCIRSYCLDKTSFNALVDSGASFTYIPKEVYERVVEEFDAQVNATSTTFQGYPWKYCYKSSSREMPDIISVTLKFALNNSFVVHNPVFRIYEDEGLVGFCLAIQPTDEDIGTIGQNFMTGYRMVFDRENLKLCWSRSNCQDLGDSKRIPLTPNNMSSNPLPTTEQQSTPGGHAVAPAVAGGTPLKPSAASTRQLSSRILVVKFLLLLLEFWHPLASSYLS